MPKLYHQDGKWIVPGQQSKSATRHDVPATPLELANWLNERAATTEASQHVDDETAQSSAQDKQPEPRQSLNPELVQQWLMDEASGAQIEQLFTALGVRFHEMRRKANGQANPV